MRTRKKGFSEGIKLKTEGRETCDVWNACNKLCHIFFEGVASTEYPSPRPPRSPAPYPEYHFDPSPYFTFRAIVRPPSWPTQQNKRDAFPYSSLMMNLPVMISVPIPGETALSMHLPLPCIVESFMIIGPWSEVNSRWNQLPSHAFGKVQPATIAQQCKRTPPNNALPRKRTHHCCHISRQTQFERA